jgi:signal transduction histidine kinase
METKCADRGPVVGDRSGFSHLVQFYERDAFLAKRVAEFVEEGLRTGEAAVLIATAPHRRAVENELRGRGFDLASAGSEGWSVSLDAVDTLGKIQRGGLPDVARATDLFGEVLRQAGAGSRNRVRVFGEMVALLCNDGRFEAAIRLEEIWNQLGRSSAFSLFCAYPIGGFGRESDAANFAAVCRQHSGVVPTERYTALADLDAHLRKVAELEQKAAALRTEIEERQRDVAERKRAERERDKALAAAQQARREAEAASHAKEVFLSLVSHELRTPLTAMLGWTKVLRGGVTGERADLALDAIERCGRAQAQLIDDLLDVSRIAGGKLRLDRREVDLGEVVRAVLEMIRPSATAKGVRIEARLDASVGCVCGDAERLRQVVWNLLSNAIKFTPRQGMVEVLLERRDARAALVVRDEGRGIAPEFLPFLFERFRQGDNLASRKTGGLGLGLAIVRQLVELHGGAVSATSNGEGLGSEFTITLPIP